MKSVTKLFLLVALFCSTAFADGNMGNGGFTDGNMGNGGKTCTSNCLFENEDSNQESETSVFDSISDYFASFFN